MLGASCNHASKVARETCTSTASLSQGPGSLKVRNRAHSSASEAAVISRLPFALCDEELPQAMGRSERSNEL